jgi:YHS domain-containing protein
MRVDPASAPAQVELDGEVVYFCSEGCLEAFTRAPHS